MLHNDPDYSSVRLPWSASDDKSRKKSALLQRQSFSSPTIIVDNEDQILLWYLPGIMTSYRVVSALMNHLSGAFLTYISQEEANQANLVLTEALQSSVYYGNDDTASWRVHHRNFHFADDQTIRPGSVNVSPGWMQVGHIVCL